MSPVTDDVGLLVVLLSDLLFLELEVIRSALLSEALLIGMVLLESIGLMSPVTDDVRLLVVLLSDLFFLELEVIRSALLSEALLSGMVLLEPVMSPIIAAL